MVYVFALLLGLRTALDNPARQTFVSEMVPREHLSNAVGLNSATFNAARLVGPGVAGLLIAWFGTGPVFLINAASFGAVLISLSRMRTRELRITPPTPRAKGQLRDGFRYVWHRPDIMLILVDRLRRRHLRDELPDDDRLHRHVDLPQGRGGVRHPRLHHGDRLAGRRAAVGPPGAAAAAATSSARPSRSACSRRSTA